MSAPDTAASRALLARKGRALPAGLGRSEPEPPGPRLGPVEDHGASSASATAGEAGMPSPAARMAAADAAEGAKELKAGEAELSPAASLLPFSLRPATPRTLDLSALVGSLPSAPAWVLGPRQAARERPPVAAPASASAGARRRRPWLWPVAGLAACGAIGAVGWLAFQMQGLTPPPGLEADQAPAPQPLAGPAENARPAAEAPAPAGPQAAIEVTSEATSEGASERPAEVADPDAGSVLGAESGPAEVQGVLEPLARAPAEAAPSAGEGAPADSPARQDEPPGESSDESQGAVEPSVDVVRIEPDGAAVIAGRAGPHSELIVLDNGRPIGTTTADAFGEWVFIPTDPLPPGDHEFGLVLKAVRGQVNVPAAPAESPAPESAPSEPAGGEGPAAEPSAGGAPTSDAPVIDKPASEAPAADAPATEGPRPAAPDQNTRNWLAPIPSRKPATGPATGGGSRSSPASPSADFVVQLASVKTRAGAEREWRKLQRRFPEILAGMKPNLDEATLDGLGTVVRVRTGPFAVLDEAAKFCALFRAERQECLVIRTAAGG